MRLSSSAKKPQTTIQDSLWYRCLWLYIFMHLFKSTCISRFVLEELKEHYFKIFLFEMLPAPWLCHCVRYRGNFRFQIARFQHTPKLLSSCWLDSFTELCCACLRSIFGVLPLQSALIEIRNKAAVSDPVTFISCLSICTENSNYTCFHVALAFTAV